MNRVGLLDRAFALRVYSNRHMKRMWGKPWDAKHRLQTSEPGAVPSLVFTPERAAELPFKIYRTGTGKKLPVYRDYRNGRTRILTQLRRFEGDVDALANDFSVVCGGKPVVRRLGRLEVVGDHKDDVVKWLSSLGV